MELDLADVLEGFGHVLLELDDQALLRDTDRLARDAVDVCDLLQGHRLLGDEALLQDQLLALAQGSGELLKLLLDQGLELSLRDLVVDAGLDSLERVEIDEVP